MITLNASGGSVTFTFSGNSTYLNDGTITVPVNSLALIIDESDFVTFKKSHSNDIFVSANIAEFGMTKDELIAWYKENMVGSTGGGGGVTSGEVQTMIDESISGKMDTSAYTVDASVNSTSTNPVQNQALYYVLSYIYSQLPYLSAIENGDFEGSGNTNFLYKPSVGNVQYCTIQDGIGKDNSRGIVVTNATAGQQFDTELFVKMNQIIKLGKKFHVEFDYKANKTINGVSTQSHSQPGQYNYWDCIGSINFTDQWQHFSNTVTVSSNMAGTNNDFQTICFTLGATADAEYYFDNFVITVEQTL